MREFISDLSGVVFFIGFIPYIIAILKKKTKPVVTSWVIWVLLDYITLAGMYTEDAVNGQIIGIIVGGTIVMFLSLVYGKMEWNKIDIFSIIIAVIGLVVWYLTNNANFTILIIASVVTIASFPTFVSAWRHPEDEDKLAWLLYWASCVLAMIAIPAFTIADVAQPLSFFIVESSMMFILFIHKPT